MQLFRTLIRHWIAVASAAIVSWLASVGVNLEPGSAAEIESALFAIVMLVFGGVYVKVEKALKRFFRDQLGEEQPGEVPKEKPE